MKCPKCSYVSHDYLDACRKCSTDLVLFKQEMHLVVMQPGDLDLSTMISQGGEGLGGRGDFSVEDDFFGTQVFVEPEATAGEEFDIRLDDDSGSVPLEEPPVVILDDAEAEANAEQVEVAEDAGEEEVVLELDTVDEAEPVGATPSLVESEADQTLYSSVDMIDMSDLEDLEVGLDALEESVIDLDAPDLDQGSPAEPALPPMPEADSPPEPDTDTEEPEAATLVFSDTDILDETATPTSAESLDETSVVEIPEVESEPVSDDLTQAEQGLESEEEAELFPSEEDTSDADTDMLFDLEHLDLNEDEEKS